MAVKVFGLLFLYGWSGHQGIFSTCGERPDCRYTNDTALESILTGQIQGVESCKERHTECVVPMSMLKTIFDLPVHFSKLAIVCREQDSNMTLKGYFTCFHTFSCRLLTYQLIVRRHDPSLIHDPR